MIKLSNIITEKKELDSKTISSIAKHTESNDHTGVRIKTAQALKNNSLEKVYKAIDEISDYYGSLPFQLSKFRHELDKDLKSQLQKKFSNFEDIWSAL